jgi:hypothetical protein
MEHGSCRIAEAVLIIRRSQWIGIPCQYIIKLDWPDGKVRGDLDIEPATNRHGERVLSAA